MPESTITAARSSEPYPGYSVLEGQYELHETGTYVIKNTIAVVAKVLLFF